MKPAPTIVLLFNGVGSVRDGIAIMFVKGSRLERVSSGASAEGRLSSYSFSNRADERGNADEQNAIIGLVPTGKVQIVTNLYKERAGKDGNLVAQLRGKTAQIGRI